MPPREAVEISATTTPITDAAPASLSAGMMCGTALGKRSLRIVWRAGGGEAAHQLERRRRRRLEPAQRADGDREEGQERAEHGDREPPRPLPPAEVQLAAPAHDERGQRDQRHRLRHDEVRQQAATDDPEAGHHRGQGHADDGAEDEPGERQPERVPGAGQHDLPHRAVRRAALVLEQALAHLPHVGHGLVVGPGQDAHAQHPAAGLGPDHLVELPGAGHEHEREEEQQDLPASRLRRDVLREGRDDVLAVRLERGVLAVVLEVDGELVDAELAQLLAAGAPARRRGRGCRSGRRSRRARSRRGCCRPARAGCSRSPGGRRCTR